MSEEYYKDLNKILSLLLTSARKLANCKINPETLETIFMNDTIYEKLYKGTTRTIMNEETGEEKTELVKTNIDDIFANKEELNGKADVEHTHSRFENDIEMNNSARIVFDAANTAPTVIDTNHVECAYCNIKKNLTVNDVFSCNGSAYISGNVISSNVKRDNETRLAKAEDDITNLQSTIDNKANAEHKHNISDVNDLQTSLDNKADAGHMHNISDVNDLQTSLDNKANVADINNLQTTLNNKANAEHSHSSFNDISINGNISFNNSGNDMRGINFTMANNDYGRVMCGGNANDDGWMEIATADNGNEPIYVRQYMYANMSNHYGEIKREIKLLDAWGNTTFPGRVYVPSITLNGNDLQSTINGLKNNILQSVYPIGSIYTSKVNKSPAELFGFGTWKQIIDRFLYATSGSSGQVGGEAAHTLTVEEMPTHSHEYTRIKYPNNTSGVALYPDGSPGYTFDYTRFQDYWRGLEGEKDVILNTDNNENGSRDKILKKDNTQNNGGGAAHNNMPPYMTVYMWERTA